MNCTERDVRLKYRYTELSYVFDLYMECELRANHTAEEYEGLKHGEFNFDYKSWERRLGFSHRQMARAIKELTTENTVIIQRERGKKGSQSRYFLARYEEQKKEQNEEHNLVCNKPRIINGLSTIEEQNQEQNEGHNLVHSSIYNNLYIKSINNYMSDSNEYRLAKYLLQHIKHNNPNAKEPNLQTWAKSFDLMIRKDKREVEEIKQVIEFSQKHNFWYKNILSADKLRKQYDRLILEMKESKSKLQQNNETDYDGWGNYKKFD